MVLDKIALGIAATGVSVSMLAHAPIVALLGVIAADASGSFLTIRKAFIMPDSETTISWLLVSVGALCSILLVRSQDVSLMLYPAYLLVANAGVVVAQAFGRRYGMKRLRQTI